MRTPALRNSMTGAPMSLRWMNTARWGFDVSSLSNVDKRKFEQLLGMGTGYVLDFSNRTFDEFALDSIGREIGDSSSSKANRLRGFWFKESDALVGKLMNDML